MHVPMRAIHYMMSHALCGTGQALKWVKAMEHSRNLKIIDLQQSNYLRVLENAVHMGMPVLLANVQEKLDPSLDPILNKSLVKIGQCSRSCLLILYNVCSTRVYVILYNGTVQATLI